MKLYRAVDVNRTAGIDDVRSRVAVLQTRFSEVGTFAARSAAEIARGGAPPSEDLLAQLTAVTADFHALRDDVLDLAADLEVILAQPDDALVTLRDLVPVVNALSATSASAQQYRRHEAGRAAALHVIDRVQAIAHEDDPAFAPLLECQASARALHAKIARSAASDGDVLTWAERLRPFADLLDMLEVEGAADDERFTQLGENVAAAFGRPLATAAVCGRLSLR